MPSEYVPTILTATVSKLIIYIVICQLLVKVKDLIVTDVLYSLQGNQNLHQSNSKYINVPLENDLLVILLSQPTKLIHKRFNEIMYYVYIIYIITSLKLTLKNFQLVLLSLCSDMVFVATSSLREYYISHVHYLVLPYGIVLINTSHHKNN